MKSFLISDDADILTGLRLAGIKGEEVKDADSARDVLKKALDDSDIGLIIVTEPVFKLLFNELISLKRKGRVSVVTIPGKDGYSGENILARSIKDSIGIRIDDDGK